MQFVTLKEALPLCASIKDKLKYILGPKIVKPEIEHVRKAGDSIRTKEVQRSISLRKQKFQLLQHIELSKRRKGEGGTD